MSSFQCPLGSKSLHFSICTSCSDPSSWARNSIYVLSDSTFQTEAAEGMKSMSNIVTCTFLTSFLTKAQSVSTAWSQLVYLNRYSLVLYHSRSHCKTNFMRSYLLTNLKTTTLLVELLTGTFHKRS